MLGDNEVILRVIRALVYVHEGPMWKKIYIGVGCSFVILSGISLTMILNPASFMGLGSGVVMVYLGLTQQL